MILPMYIFFQDTEYSDQAILIPSPFGRYTSEMLVLAFCTFPGQLEADSLGILKMVDFLNLRTHL